MDENSLESCDPTVADVGCRFVMWRTGFRYATLECCLFCVASYHLGRDALRVTVDGANNIELEIGCQAAT